MGLDISQYVVNNICEMVHFINSYGNKIQQMHAGDFNILIFKEFDLTWSNYKQVSTQSHIIL